MEDGSKITQRVPEALKKVVEGFPEWVFVDEHTSTRMPGVLPELGRPTLLFARSVDEYGLEELNQAFSPLIERLCQDFYVFANTRFWRDYKFYGESLYWARCTLKEVFGVLRSVKYQQIIPDNRVSAEALAEFGVEVGKPYVYEDKKDELYRCVDVEFLPSVRLAKLKAELLRDPSKIRLDSYFRGSRLKKEQYEALLVDPNYVDVITRKTLSLET